MHGKQSLGIDPNRGEAAVLIASVFRKTGRAAEAKSFYEKALALKADDKPALAGLAYLLSTGETPEIRDGTAAVRYARRLCELTGSKYPNYLSILACAYAEAGQFDNAIQTAAHGLIIARSSGDVRWAKALENQVDTFKQHQPFRTRLLLSH